MATNYAAAPAAVILPVLPSPTAAALSPPPRLSTGSAAAFLTATSGTNCTAGMATNRPPTDSIVILPNTTSRNTARVAITPPIFSATAVAAASQDTATSATNCTAPALAAGVPSLAAAAVASPAVATPAVAISYLAAVFPPNAASQDTATSATNCTATSAAAAVAAAALAAVAAPAVAAALAAVAALAAAVASSYVTTRSMLRS